MSGALAFVVVAVLAVAGGVALHRSGVAASRAAWVGMAGGAGAAVIGSMAVMVPLDFCTFGDEASAIDLWFGIVLMVGASFVAFRVISSLLDPETANKRRESGDDITHGAFKANPIVPWLLLAPTLAVLAVFLYWPALKTLRLSTRLARLGAPRQADKCVANFTELIGPSRPWLLLVMALVPIFLMGGAKLAGQKKSRSAAKWQTWLTTAAVASVLIALALLWTEEYRAVFMVTLIISFGTVIGGLVISLAIAYLAYQPIRGAGIYRTLLVWPYAISPPIAGLLFFVMFDANSGIIEHWLDTLIGVALPDYRTSAGLAQFVVILASIWKTLGYNLLFYIAGLQTVPKDQIEAAMLDGATGWARFRYIVIPALSPITFFLIVTNLTYAFFETYGTIDYLTAGGPAGKTSVAMYEIIQVAIPGRDLGRGAAQSLVLFGGVVALTIWQFRSTGRKVHYG